ncbi:putative secreted protein [Sinobacterium caligoides]|uniref:Putative secreted protein n=1 Tax=Sinobacterium caligoides TaxID=933926 RepID=A0A3N2DKF3_9GAMM|nr:VPLPA-CTERM sorting domain-containing protein [Sinobacterium caligoides]ROS00276.1 putative secreted protein [Sinobacterium caligoides]
MKKTSLIISAIALAASSTASAGNFDFNKFAGGYHNSLSFSANGANVGLTATALGGSKVSWTNEGLGRGSNGLNYKMSGGEALSFSFTKAVDIGTIDVIGISSASINWTAANGDTGIFSNATDDAAVNLFNITNMTITAEGNFITIKGMDDVFVSQVNEVPLPAAAWLFGSALLGLSGLARRRRA